ncbi:hypothetical protein Pla108_13650 [Botrimarina colliarenosi]|uniref:Lipoprotein n=1 Tax=Botrimarina colliarenosi TaxID=2528001 RepID=A0A5C6AQE2_9BACT|nr:hypothetical protein [Botrimarina colliarenosi]TWU00414.1 hypothetical protein Pla108_13650 [Botrimarina colliarenosi]
MAYRPTVLALAASLGLLGGTTVKAQFATVYNVPPDSLPTRIDAFGRLTNRVLTSDTQVNIADGASFYDASSGTIRGIPVYIGDSSISLTNTEVNVAGGEVDDLWVYDGVAVSVSGGAVDTLIVEDGAIASVTGGDLGSLTVRSGGHAVASDGVIRRYEIDGGTGVLAAGADVEFLDVNEGSLVVNGGVVRSLTDVLASGSLTVNSGRFEDSVAAQAGATLDIRGGEFLDGIGMPSGVQAILSGGYFDKTFGGGLSAYGATTLVGAEFVVDGQPMSINQATPITVTRDIAGVFPNGTPFAFSRSDGDGFRTSGVSFTLSPAAPPAPIAGVYFASLSPTFRSVRAGQTLIIDAGGIVPGPLGIVGGGAVVQPGGVVNDDVEVSLGELIVEGGLLNGTLKAFGGGVVIYRGGEHEKPIFDANARALAGGAVRVEGGVIDRIQAVEGDLAITGGQVDFASAEAGSVDLAGGALRRLDLRRRQTATSGIQGSKLVAAGGTIDSLTIEHGSSAWIGSGVVGEAKLINGSGGPLVTTLTVAGGRIEGDVSMRQGSLRILGGEWIGGIVAPSDPVFLSPATIDLFGVKFSIDGQPVALNPGESLAVPFGEGLLTATLTDGEVFTLDLAAELPNTDAVSIHLVPQWQGDFNNDGVVDSADYTVWRDAASSGDSVADADYDGVVDHRDYTLWRLRFGTTYGDPAMTVPEPAAAGATLLGFSLLARRARRNRF